MRCRTTTIRAGLLGSLLLALPCVEGAALCVGLDGHIGMKLLPRLGCPEGAGGCEPGNTGAETVSSESEHSHPCGPCIDIPLPAVEGAERATQAAPRTRGARRVVPCPAVASAVLSAPEAHLPVAFCSGAPPGDPARDVVQTVVLRI